MKYIRTIRLTQPLTEPITLSEAKTFLRIDHTDSDTEIAAMISAAREAVENYCNRYFAEVEVAILYDRFPSSAGPIPLPYPDVQSVVGINYIDSNGDAIDMGISPPDYTLDSDRQRITIDNSVGWPTGYDIRVHCVVGVSPSNTVKRGMLLYIADMYETRQGQIVGTITSPNESVMHLLTPYRVEMGM